MEFNVLKRKKIYDQLPLYGMILAQQNSKSYIILQNMARKKNAVTRKVIKI